MKKSSKSKNTKRSSQNEKTSVSGHCVILEGYLKGWAPAPEPGPGVIYKTTREIIDELEDMAELNFGTVIDIMASLGFRTEYAFNGGSLGWMMLKSPGTVHTIRPATPEDEDPGDD